MFFNRKSTESEKKKTKTVPKIAHQRLLTAEGRRRQMAKKHKKSTR